MHAKLEGGPGAIILAVAAVTAGCDESDRVPTASFAELFGAADTIMLEEPDSAPITGIRDFVATEDGRLVLIDRARPEVRLYDSNGQLIRTVGRFGDGPGEFRNPMAAAVDRDGHLLVADAESDLLTRFTADMAYDTAWNETDLSRVAFTTSTRGSGPCPIGRASLFRGGPPGTRSS